MIKAQELIKDEIKQIDSTIRARRSTSGVTASDSKPWDKTTAEEQAQIELEGNERYAGYNDIKDQEAKDWTYLAAYAHVVLLRTVDLYNKRPEYIDLTVDDQGRVYEKTILKIYEIEQNCIRNTLPF